MQNFNEIDTLYAQFLEEWNSSFSHVFLRQMVEGTVKSMYYETNSYASDDDNKIDFGSRISWIQKYIEKNVSFNMQSALDSLNELKSLWYLTSQNVHVGRKFEVRKIEKQTLQQWATKAVVHCKNLTSIILDDEECKDYPIVILEHKEIENVSEKFEAEETISKLQVDLNEQKATISSLQEKLQESSEVYKQLEQFQEQLLFFEQNDLQKNIEISKLNEVIDKFNDIAHGVDEIEKNVALNWTQKIRRTINKDIYQTIIFGESKFRKYVDINKKLLGEKSDIDPKALEIWKLKQEMFDDAMSRVAEEVEVVPEINTFSTASNNSGMVQNNPNIRYVDAKNAHVVFLDLADKYYQEAKKFNFFFSNFIKETYQWNLYSCWVKGINFVNVVVFNKDTKEFQVLPKIDLRTNELIFKNQDKIITNYLKGLIENGN